MENNPEHPEIENESSDLSMEDIRKELPYVTQIDLPEEKGSIWSIIAAILVIIALIIAGLFLWGQYLVRNEAHKNQVFNPAGIIENDIVTERFESQSSSDELESIERDLNSTNLNLLNEDLNTIETILNNR
jgi:hypothetical protein